MSFLQVTNASGARLTLSAYGARLVGLTLPDRDGNFDDCVLGFDTEQEVKENVGGYFGATVGRVAGRTANAHFVGGGLDLELTANDGPHTLHGGTTGRLDNHEWRAEQASDHRGVGYTFRTESAAGAGGYPGNVRVASTYLLADDNTLTCEMRAVSDADTPIALTQHAYWNLTSGGRGTVVDDELWIASTQRVGMTDELVPTGEIVPVVGTGFDFTQARRIGALLPSDTGVPWPGIDHTYLLDGRADAIATLYSPSTGRHLELFTTEPALQVYLGCHLNNVAGRADAVYEAGSGICLETVRFPDSPLLPDLPSVVLAAGAEYVQESVYRFSIH
jgi:aldose 1-epimerase